VRLPGERRAASMGSPRPLGPAHALTGRGDATRAREHAARALELSRQGSRHDRSRRAKQASRRSQPTRSSIVRGDRERSVGPDARLPGERGAMRSTPRGEYGFSWTRTETCPEEEPARRCRGQAALTTS
jgi:hypothetical protein